MKNAKKAKIQQYKRERRLKQGQITTITTFGTDRVRGGLLRNGRNGQNAMNNVIQNEGSKESRDLRARANEPEQSIY